METDDLVPVADKSSERPSRKAQEIMERKENNMFAKEGLAYLTLAAELTAEEGSASETTTMPEPALGSTQQTASTRITFRPKSITADATLMKPKRPPPIPPRPVKKKKPSEAIIQITSPEGSMTILNMNLSSSSLDSSLTGFVPDKEPEEPKREPPKPPEQASAQRKSYGARMLSNSPDVPALIAPTSIEISEEVRTHVNGAPKVPPRPSRYRQKKTSCGMTELKDPWSTTTTSKEGKIIPQEEDTTNNNSQRQSRLCEQNSQRPEDEDNLNPSASDESTPLFISNFTFSSPAFATLNDVVHPPLYTNYIPPATLEVSMNDHTKPTLNSHPQSTSPTSYHPASRSTLIPRPSESCGSPVAPQLTSPQFPSVSPEVVPSYCQSDQQVAISPPTRSFKFPRLRPRLALQPQPLQPQYSHPPWPQSSNIQPLSRPQPPSSRSYSPSWPSSPQRIAPALPPSSLPAPLPQIQSFPPQISAPNLTYYERIALMQRQSMQYQSISSTPTQSPTSNPPLSRKRILEYGGAFAPPASLPKPNPMMEPVMYYYA